jgi:hypothetical protein
MRIIKIKTIIKKEDKKMEKNNNLDKFSKILNSDTNGIEESTTREEVSGKVEKNHNLKRNYIGGNHG